MSKFIACIPARGGSKGIPNKNIINLAGKPLVSYTLEAALDCMSIENKDIYVSTDSRDITKVCSRYLGANQIIVRPDNLATDTAKTYHVVEHLLTMIDYSIDDYIVLLQPTSPLRGSGHIDEAVNLIQTNSNINSLISVTIEEHSPYKSFITRNGLLEPLFEREKLSMPRQKLNQVYRPNGSIYINRISSFLKSQDFFVEPCIAYEMGKAESIDIDEPSDLFMTEKLLEFKVGH